MTQYKEHLVYGERIKEARECKGLSQTALAECIEVQRQSVSAYEKNRIKPSAETLFKIASVTHFPYTFFLNDRPRGSENRTTPITFRKLESSTKTAHLQAEQYENLLADIYYYLKIYIDFFMPNVPLAGTIDYQSIDDEDIEDIAAKVRRAWGLGNGPIPHLIRLLENNGIIIAPTKLAGTVDAFSTWRHDRPIIMLSDVSTSCCRRRFNAAHELGHLVLHALVDEEDFKKSHKELEKQAHRFAGAFLFPLPSINHEFFSCSISALLKLKERWKVSMAAIGKRLYELDMINQNQYRYINIQLGSKWKEPFDDKIPMEEPSLLKKAFNMLIEHKIVSIRQVLEDILIPQDIFSMITTLEFPIQDETIIPFKVRDAISSVD
jgi:Zn-dependent peptidase ImmA (M78 family)/transcriptional regulator with XRE-family HTH domain